jgi:hypothetical protein
VSGSLAAKSATSHLTEARTSLSSAPIVPSLEVRSSRLIEARAEPGFVAVRCGYTGQNVPTRVCLVGRPEC